MDWRPSIRVKIRFTSIGELTSGKFRDKETALERSLPGHTYIQRNCHFSQQKQNEKYVFVFCNIKLCLHFLFYFWRPWQDPSSPFRGDNLIIGREIWLSSQFRGDSLISAEREIIIIVCVGKKSTGALDLRLISKSLQRLVLLAPEHVSSIRRA